MMPRLTLFELWLVFAGLCALAAWVSYRRRARARWPQVFFSFWGTLSGALVSRAGLAVLAGAALATWGLVASGLDRDLQAWFQESDPLGREFSRAFLVGGNYWHPLMGGLILVWARVRHNRTLFTAAAAALQAIIASGLVVNGLKWMTGRRGPARILVPDWNDLSMYAFVRPFKKTHDPSDFALDFWNHGFADGRFFWPSGHTATAFAFAAAWTVAFYMVVRAQRPAIDTIDRRGECNSPLRCGGANALQRTGGTCDAPIHNVDANAPRTNVVTCDLTMQNGDANAHQGTVVDTMDRRGECNSPLRCGGGMAIAMAVLLWGTAIMTGVAMIDGDFHWTSDVIAGAPLGTLIGVAVGRAFARRENL
ncbi:MAG TPA: phosphatase PAP2 family protein [Spirochaetota bacterium]|nr:phosphatase PAP2 family protein [Spirochaetota bacterium]